MIVKVDNNIFRRQLPNPRLNRDMARANKVSTFIALISAALIDGVVMSVYFANYLSASTIGPIVLKEISFKCLYAFVILSAVKLVSAALGKYEFQDFRFKLRN